MNEERGRKKKKGGEEKWILLMEFAIDVPDITSLQQMLVPSSKNMVMHLQKQLDMLIGAMQMPI